MASENWLCFLPKVSSFLPTYTCLSSELWGPNSLHRGISKLTHDDRQATINRQPTLIYNPAAFNYLVWDTQPPRAHHPQECNKTAIFMQAISQENEIMEDLGLCPELNACVLSEVFFFCSCNLRGAFVIQWVMFGYMTQWFSGER